MRLFVSSLLLLAAAAAFGQNRAMMSAAEAACPLSLTSAGLAPDGHLLPVADAMPSDGALDLHFRNDSGKAIRSAELTARLRVKTDVYALDATPLELHLTFSGTGDRDKAVDQLTRIPLPLHAYAFGVARVTLNQVKFSDGSVWIARSSGSCAVGGPGQQRIEAK